MLQTTNQKSYSVHHLKGDMAPGVTHEEDSNAYDSLESERNSVTNTPDKIELKAIRAAYNEPKLAILQNVDVNGTVHECDKYDKTDLMFSKSGTPLTKSDVSCNRSVTETQHSESQESEVLTCRKGISRINSSIENMYINGANNRTNVSEALYLHEDKGSNIHMDDDGNADNTEEGDLQSEAMTLLENEKDVQLANADDTKESINTETITEEITKAPDGGWGWFIILGALLLRIIIGGMGRSHGLFYIKFRERYEGSATATAFVTSLTGIFRLGGGPFVSVMCTRFKCRYLTLIGACLLSIGLILTGFSPSIQFLYFSYGVICGLGRAFALTPVPILLGYYFDKRRSLAFGLASAGFSIGGFGVTPTVELMFQTFGFQGTYLLLSGFALNILVCSALFRPIELHRRLTQKRSKNQKNDADVEKIIVRSIEDIQSGQIISSSTLSIERIRTTSRSISKDSHTSTHEHTGHGQDIALTRQDNENALFINSNDDVTSKLSEIDLKSSKRSHDDVVTHTQSNIDASYCSNKKEASILHAHDSAYVACEDARVSLTDEQSDRLTHTRKEEGNNSTHNDGEKTQKPPLIAWSILKDVRFFCFCLSNFLLTLPVSALFLPSLAIARGASELEAATLLSINAGCDTVFRVISGFILDLKLFRNYRPQVYSTVVVIQGIVTLLYPLMTSYTGFVMLCLADGAFAGMKSAQNSVVVMDILGVDKLASSMAITMSVQAVAILIGPTVSGQLRDISGVYDGAFYFGGTAIILGGLVMTCGNIRKYLMDRRKKKEEKLTGEEISLTHAV